mgnify:CR=1 FL=1
MNHECIGVDEAGNLMAMTEKDGQIDILYFGPKEETEGTLRLANLWYNGGSVEDCFPLSRSMSSACTKSRSGPSPADICAIMR